MIICVCAKTVIEWSVTSCSPTSNVRIVLEKQVNGLIHHQNRTVEHLIIPF